MVDPGSSDLIRAVLDTASDGMLVLDPQGRIVLMNPVAERVLGWKEAELRGQVGHAAFHFLHPDRRPFPAEECPFFLALTSSGRVESRELFVAKDGRFVPVAVVVQGLRQGGEASGMIVSFQDLSERRQAEAQLKLHRAALDAAANMVLITDASGIVQYANRAFTARTGYEAHEVVGEKVGVLRSGLQARSFYTEMWRTVLSGDVWEGELINRRKDGSLYPEEQTITPLKDETGKVSHFVAIKRDITERKQAEQELEKTRDEALAASRLKSEFLSTVSHEIRTPMNGVLGMADLLMDTALSAEQRDFLGILKESAVALLSIIDDILDFSKIEAEMMRVDSVAFDPASVVEGVVGLLSTRAFGKGLALTSFISPAIPTPLQGDPGRLRQVLLNLAGNALKFTEKGEVTLRVGLQEASEETSTLRFEVRDTGIGLSEAARRRLFQPFVQADGSTTRRYGGTGLGLSISKHLVELMGGEMGVESREGAGSTFWFTLPFQHGRLAEGTSDPSPLHRVRVLLVGGDAAGQEIAHRYISSWGMRNGAQAGLHDALEVIRQAASEGDPFGVVIVDSSQAEDVALCLGRQVASDPALGATRLVLLADLDRRLVSDQTSAAGYAAHLTKPLRQSQLFDCLVELASSGRQAQAEDPAPLRAGRAHFAPRRLLLVEDNPINQRVAQAQLRRLGVEPHVAASGTAALEAFSGDAYDLILMDCQMPLMDGFEATRLIRLHEAPQGRRVPIVAMTANAMRGDREKCLEAGMDDYLSKPFTQEQLAAVLARWLGDDSPGAAAPPADLDARALPCVDLARLRAVVDPEEAGLLLGLFVESLPEIQARIGDALAREDARALVSVVHELKGTAANLGVAALAAICRRMEETSDWNGLRALEGELAQEAARVRAFVGTLKQGEFDG
ncbi:MAG TPA: PAS domain S-box protein [Pantanalinema sp.]